MRTNPNDPYSKILVVAGGDADQVLIAAQAVALHSDMLAGAQATIDNLRLPDKQQPDGAPRWARTDQTIALWDYATADQLQGDGSAPLERLLPHSAGHLLRRAAQCDAASWCTATTRFPSAPFRACRCASTTHFWARFR